MALNFNNSNNYLHVVSNKVIAGQNTEEVHATWNDVTTLTLEDNFKVGSTSYRGGWTQDGGDMSAPENTREPRAFCVTGKCTIQFTGTTVAIRVSVNPQWGKASVLIDGVKPSLISGVVTPVDTLSCNADDYGSWGNESFDVVVADNLPAGPHTLTLTCTANGGQAYFVMSGYKVYSRSKVDLYADRWSISMADREQPISLSFQARGSMIAEQVSVTFNSLLLDPTTKTPLGTKSLGQLASGTPYVIPVLPNFTGTEATGNKPASVALSYLVPDPAGTIPITAPVTIPYNSGLFVQSPAGLWSQDTSTFPEPVLYGTGAANLGCSLSFPSAGDSITLRLGRLQWDSAIIVATKSTDYFGVIKRAWTCTSGQPNITYPAGTNLSGVQVGMTYCGDGFPANTTVLSVSGMVVTMSKNAQRTISTGSRCSSYCRPVGQVQATAAASISMGNYTISGFGSSFNGTVVLIPNSVTNNTGGNVTSDFALASVQTTTAQMYSQVTDNLVLDFQMKQVPPQPITEVWLENGQVQYTAPDPEAYDLTADEPYDNRGVESIEVDYRFPTFLCCYTAGFDETFKQYDVVITDPGALNYGQTKALRDLGIKVYHYVSFGEEDGTLTDRYDANASLGPYTGDGQGPGGYASYYMKGGYDYGEQSECTFDNERLLGTRTCAQSQPQYRQGLGGATSPGRCSKTCLNDWRDGYIEWEAGGQCSAGFTSANNWQRDATNACSNAACPQYSPVNNKCPKYQQAENVWGQDYSLLTQDFPDENGIWSSYFINAVGRGAGSWFARLRDYYLPLLFGSPTPVDETILVKSHTIGTDTMFVTDMTQAPIDEGFAFSIKDKASGYEYTPNVDYSMDKMSGAIIFDVAVATDGDPQVAPLPYVGQQIQATYTKRGLEADGVFMDTVDTVDVYPRADYQQAFADLINDLKALHPTKDFCSNRGFTIYDKILGSCALIMTESVFSDYNFDTGTYQLVSPEAAAWNAEVAKMIQGHRETLLFDVVCLNYAPNDSSGDAIRATVQQQTLDQGWMPWLSTILLNSPLPNDSYTKPSGYIRTNDWRPARKVIPIKPI